MIVPAGTITTGPHAAHIDTAMREGTHYDYAAQRWLDGQDHLHVTSAGNPRGDRLLDAATVLATCAVAHAVAQLNPTADVGAGDTA